MRKLIIGKIPRFYAEDHAKWTAFHMRLANEGIEFRRCQKALGIFGVISKDARTELHFAPRLADPLTHFRGHRAGEHVDPLFQQRSSLVQDDRALVKACVPPAFKTGLGHHELQFEIGVGNVTEVSISVPVKGLKLW
jgi:hypothetical protein